MRSKKYLENFTKKAKPKEPKHTFTEADGTKWGRIVDDDDEELVPGDYVIACQKHGHLMSFCDHEQEAHR